MRVFYFLTVVASLSLMIVLALECASMVQNLTLIRIAIEDKNK